MKSRYSSLLTLVALACSVLTVRAQFPTTTETATHAVVTVTGTTGSICMIEATGDLAQVDGWSPVGLFQLKPGPNQWVDATAPVAGKRFYRAVEQAVQPAPNMVFINPTSYSGTTINQSLVNIQVTLTKGFYINKYKVTEAEYAAVMGLPTNTSDSPVVVNLTDTKEYCVALTNSERAAGRCPATWAYQLATAAEWEYAAQAGKRYADQALAKRTYWGSVYWPENNIYGGLPNPFFLYMELPRSEIL